jgi:PEP-CTERM motif
VRSALKVLVALVFVGSIGTSASAAPITIDEILYASGTDPVLLSGLVDITLSGNQLLITLTNTSVDEAGTGAGILLTGIAFQLPTGISVTGGSAYMGTSTAVGFTAPADGDVSEEWGFDSPPLNSGSFLGIADLSYNTAAGSMVSITTTQFQSGSIGDPVNLGGPDFGVISNSETDPGGQEAIRNTIYLTLLLSGTVPGNLVSLIEAGNVGISFGSPDSSNRVPEPSSLWLAALGAGFAFLPRLRRLRA